MTDQPVPTVEEANQELMVLELQAIPMRLRGQFLQGVIAGRQAEQDAKPKARTRRT